MKIIRLQWYVALIWSLLLLPAFASAASPLTVNFEATPLFSNAQIAPGMSVARTVQVLNTGTDTQTVYTSVQNMFSTGLAEAMQLTITSSSTTYFSGTFANFFATAPVTLGSLVGGSDRLYTFTASLPTTADNTIQQKTFGFDLLIGFVGGPVVVNTGGGGGGSIPFLIYNEAVASSSTPNLGATLTWNTTLPGTTYLVCGNTAQGPYTLSTQAPLFGYQFSVPEDMTSVITHTQHVTVPSAGTYECRPAGRQNSSNVFTVGEPLQFTISPSGLVLGASTSTYPIGTNVGGTQPQGTTAYPRGSVLGIATSTASSTAGLQAIAGPTTLVSSTPDVVLPADTCTLWWLLLLIDISFLWSFIDDLLRHDDAPRRRFFFQNAVIALAYISIVFALFELHQLDRFWWVGALVWVMVVANDYRLHMQQLIGWQPLSRNIFFTLAGIGLAVSAWVTHFPCQWWPFAAIAVGSLFLSIVHRPGRE